MTIRQGSVLKLFWMICSISVVCLSSPEHTIILEEDLNIIEDELIEHVGEKDADYIEKKPHELQLGVTIGVVYAPMLWVKESYFDAFAVPLGFFEKHSPIFSSVQFDFHFKMHGKPIHLIFPFSIALSRVSSTSPLLISSEGSGLDTFPKIEERIARSLSIGMVDVGAALSMRLFNVKNLHVSLLPELDFVYGFAKMKMDKPVSLYYFKGEFYYQLSEKAFVDVIDHAFGLKVKGGINISYSVTPNLYLTFSSSISRIWSTVFWNPDYGTWVGKGLDGKERDVRLNSMAYGINAGASFIMNKIYKD